MEATIQRSFQSFKNSRKNCSLIELKGCKFKNTNIKGLNNKVS